MNRILPIANKVAIVLIAVLIITYIGDFISVHYRMRKPTPNNPFESVSIDRMYAVLQKSGKSEFIPADTQTVTCVHSLFPHAGYNPCWYVTRQNNTTIPMSILSIHGSRF
jgi:hypothetical protein